MNRIERVVVDECVGHESPLVGQLRERLGERTVKFVFLATEHPGIPDIEILDKLLDVRSALLTQDRVLHNLAIGRGFQSFVHTPESGLTDRRLVHVSASDKHLPVASGALRDSYRHQSNPEAQAITECLYSFLSAHQLKQFRTKRRRIRAHFGSPDNIVAAALTIGQRRTTQGMVGGYVLKVDARHGVKSLFPASESFPKRLFVWFWKRTSHGHGGSSTCYLAVGPAAYHAGNLSGKLSVTLVQKLGLATVNSRGWASASEDKRPAVSAAEFGDRCR
jgi:hypothetical protein